MWKPIEDAPKTPKKIFVVIGKNIKMTITNETYTTDPFCVRAYGDTLIGWPHPFKPTHFLELPE